MHGIVFFSQQTIRRCSSLSQFNKSNLNFCIIFSLIFSLISQFSFIRATFITMIRLISTTRKLRRLLVHSKTPNKYDIKVRREFLNILYIYIDVFRNKFKSFSLIETEKMKYDYVYLSWLARCYIRNNKARLAWELYLKLEQSTESFNLLQLIANDCYKVNSHFYQIYYILLYILFKKTVTFFRRWDISITQREHLI